MKLFIINRDDFSPIMDGNHDRNPSVYKSAKQVHQAAFNELSESVGKGLIPIQLMPDYKNFGCCIFEFRSVKNDVYFYEFITTAS